MSDEEDTARDSEETIGPAMDDLVLAARLACEALKQAAFILGTHGAFTAAKLINQAEADLREALGAFDADPAGQGRWFRLCKELVSIHFEAKARGHGLEAAEEELFERASRLIAEAEES